MSTVINKSLIGGAAAGSSSGAQRNVAESEPAMIPCKICEVSVNSVCVYNEITHLVFIMALQ